MVLTSYTFVYVGLLPFTYVCENVCVYSEIVGPAYTKIRTALVITTSTNYFIQIFADLKKL